MKIKTLVVILFSLVSFANAQSKEECINIIESNLTNEITNIIKITIDNNKFTVLSEKDNKKYKLSIGLTNITEFSNQVVIGARISIRTIDDIKYICVARKEEARILTTRFRICN